MSVEWTMQIVCDGCKNHRSSRLMFTNPDPDSLMAMDKLLTEIKKKNWTKEFTENRKRMFFFCARCSQARRERAT